MWPHPPRWSWFEQFLNLDYLRLVTLYWYYIIVHYLVNGKIISITYSATSSLSIQFSDLLATWFFFPEEWFKRIFYVHSFVKIIFTPSPLWTQPTSKDIDLNKKNLQNTQPGGDSTQVLINESIFSAHSLWRCTHFRNC